MKYYFLSFAGFFAISCNNNNPVSTNKEAEVSSKSLQEIISDNLAKHSKNDTIFLNFVLGATKEKTERRFSELLTQKKIEPKSIEQVSLIQLEGYPYILQFNEAEACRSLILHSYYDNKLYSLTLCFVGACNLNKSIEFLTSIYGKPDFSETKKEEYTDSKRYYWIDGNKQVVLEASHVTAIEFTDLRLQRKKADEQTQENNREKQRNKDRAKKTKTDFK